MITNNHKPIAFHILDQLDDPLWCRYPALIDPAAPVIDLWADRQNHTAPSFRDGPGWQRWLRQQQIGHIHLWQPGRRTLMLLTALALENIPATLWLTNPLTWHNEFLINGLRHFFGRIVCFSTTTAQWLTAMGVDRMAIRLRTPEPVAAVVGPAQAHQLRQRLNPSGPLLAALPAPTDKKVLYTLLWGVALACHVRRNIKLALCGPISPRLREDILQIVASWSCPELVCFEPEGDWDALLAACDLVVDSQFAGWNSLRLAHALAARRPVVSADRSSRTLLERTPDNCYLTETRPRILAGGFLAGLAKIPGDIQVSI